MGREASGPGLAVPFSPRGRVSVQPAQTHLAFLGCPPAASPAPPPLTFLRGPRCGPSGWGLLGAEQALLTFPRSTALQGWDLGDILVQKPFRNLDLKSSGTHPPTPI